MKILATVLATALHGIKSPNVIVIARGTAMTTTIGQTVVATGSTAIAKTVAARAAAAALIEARHPMTRWIVGRCL
jgi:hypothetical protein